MSGWSIYWACWAALSFLTFIVPEAYALTTDASHTLSETIWRLEELQRGQHFLQWHAAHILIGGILLVLLLWLAAHLVFGIWH